MLTDFHNSFTVVFSEKFATKPMSLCPSHLRRVAALPCEKQETEICEILLHLTQ